MYIEDLEGHALANRARSDTVESFEERKRADSLCSIISGSTASTFLDDTLMSIKIGIAQRKVKGKKAPRSSSNTKAVYPARFDEKQPTAKEDVPDKPNALSLGKPSNYYHYFRIS